jgi:hypothetical protein
LDGFDQAFDGRKRLVCGGREDILPVADAGGAALQAANDRAWRDGIRPKKFQKRKWLDAHLVNAAVDVAAVQETEKSGKANLDRVRPQACTGGLQERAGDGSDCICRNGRALEKLPNFAEAPSIIRQHRAFGRSKKPGNHLAGE